MNVQVCDGIDGEVYNLNHPLEVPGGTFQPAKAILDADEAARKGRKTDWKTKPHGAC